MRVKQWISLFLCVIILLPGCAASEEKKTEREIFAMDTIMNLTFYGENGEQAMTAAVSEIQQLEKTLSVTKADSEISKINAAGGKKVTENMICTGRIFVAVVFQKRQRRTCDASETMDFSFFVCHHSSSRMCSF